MARTFRDKLKKDIVLLDGAFGTYAYSLGLNDAYFKDKPGCMEYLSFARPDLIEKIHKDYLAAGCDAIETNTFGGSSLKLAEYDLSERTYEINLAATKIARSACDLFSKNSFPRFVIGTMGPTGKLPSSNDPELGNISYDELKEIFYEQALGIIDGGADALLIETGQDLLEMKSAVNGAKTAIKEKKKDIVLMAQCTLSNNGRMLLGTEVSAMMATLGYLGVDVIGLNCSTGPVEMERNISFLSENCTSYVSCVPNAGLPEEIDGKTVYTLGAKEMSEIIRSFLQKYRIDIVGGCCGTSPDHIRAIREVISTGKKRKRPVKHFYSSFYSGFDIDNITRPIKVGERINTQGSRKMKKLLLEEKYESIVEIGKAQQKDGANIIDVCTVLTERQTEKKDAVFIFRKLSESVNPALMIDSTDVEVVESALKNYPGTAFINSVNLEDGGGKARRIFALAKEYGSFVVNLVIDENGMAKTCDDKVRTAGRLYDIATKEYGIESHRLIYDLLTFSLGTGETEEKNSAVETFEAIRKIKKKYPGVLTILGVSNISFGLSQPARKILNMAYLHNAVKTGLDMAIINPADFVEYNDMESNGREKAETLILNKKPDALNGFIEYFNLINTEKTDKNLSADIPDIELSISEKIKKCIYERDKTGIITLLEESLKDNSPEKIVNTILLEAMRKVGDMFENGEIVLPFVLQSAEVMKKATDYLNAHMGEDTKDKKGKVLLATVFGDVHDIGKNLVKMVLGNNGFEVIDLGKQVPIEKVVEKAKENNVDAVGLSALLISTARHMKTCVEQMREAGLEYPILIGGAPINKEFAKTISYLSDNSVYKGGVFYAKDAFTGLKIMQTLMDPNGKKGMYEDYHKQFVPVQNGRVKESKYQSVGNPEEDGSRVRESESQRIRESEEDEGSVKVSECQSVRESGKNDESVKESKRQRVKANPGPRIPGPVPIPPFYGVRTLNNIPVDEVFSLLDEKMLFNISWKTNLKDKNIQRDIIKKEFKPLLQELKEEAIRNKWMDLKAVYGYFKCRVKNDVMQIFGNDSSVLGEIMLSRTQDEKCVSLADYFNGSSRDLDLVAFQAVTVGSRIGKAIETLDNKKEVTRAFLLHGLSVNLAEALAKYVHDRVRKELKIKPDQGKRYSPGYPLWKSLKDQQILFNILDIEKNIGIKLTEDFQMIPEQSTTAMIVYNEQAAY